MENKLEENVRLSSNYYKQDKSDRKATDMLINSLFSKNVTPPKLKQSSLDKYCSNWRESTIPKAAKKNKQVKKQKRAKKLSNVSSSRLTSIGWLNMVQTNKVGESPKKATAEAHATDTNTSETLRELSSSYKQYGNETYEELLEESRVNEQGKKCLRSIVYGEVKQLPDTTELEEVEDQSTFVDCTHLSLTQIKQAFVNNIDYIACVNDKYRYSHISLRNISRIVSMIVFTYEQKLVLSSLLYENFGGDNDNYFKVLLPELCMKIFMDVFNMSYDEAYNYLKERPVEM